MERKKIRSIISAQKLPFLRFKTKKPMRGEFLGNLVFLLFINLVVKPTYLFGIERVVQNSVQEELFGVYFSIVNLTLIFNVLSDFGLQGYNARHIAQHPHLLPKYFSDFLLTKALLALLYTVVLLIAGALLGYLQDYPFILLGMMAGQVLNSMVLYLRSNLAGLGMYWIDSLLSVLDRSLVIVFLGIPLWMGRFDQGFPLQHFVNVQLTAFGVAALVAFVLVVKRAGLPVFRLKKARVLAVLRAGVPFVLTYILMNLYTRADAPMMEQMLPNGKVQANLYASAFRLLEASNVIGFLFAGLLMPMYARMLKAGQNVAPLAHLGIQIIWSGAISLAMCCLVFRLPIMTSLYTTGGPYSAQLLGWLMLSFIPMSGVYIFGSLLTAQGSLKQLNRVYVCGVILNFSLNLLLIPKWQALGAAVANFSTQTILFAAQLFLCHKIMGFSVTTRQVGQFFALGLGAWGLAWLAHQHLYESIRLWAFVLAFLGTCFWALLLRLIPIRELFKTLKASS
jgi:O-antigen/teichoic acid export membrane protein